MAVPNYTTACHTCSEFLEWAEDCTSGDTVYCPACGREHWIDFENMEADEEDPVYFSVVGWEV